VATVKISDLTPAGTDPVDADIFPAVQDSSSATKTFTMAEISSKVQSDVDAAIISASKYTNIAPSGSTITFSDTSDIAEGEALKIVQNDGPTTRYVLITDITGTTVTVSGATLTGTPTTITSIARLAPARVIQLDIFCPGLYAVDGADIGLIARETRSLLRWHAPTAYLLYAAARHATQDTDSGSQPTLNITVDGSDAFNTDITMPNGATWQAVAGGDADINNYTVNFESAIEIDLTDPGGNQDARDLLVSLALVLD